MTDQRSPRMGIGGLPCPECGYPLPSMTITKSTVPVELLTFCGGCGVQVLEDGTVGARSQAQWAEHYDGDILRFPQVEL